MESKPLPLTRWQLARQILVLAWPVMLARAGLVVMVMVSTVLCGQAGVDVLAAYAISFAPHITLLVLGIGLMASTTILAAQAVGGGRRKDAGAIWRMALVIGTVLGLIEGGILAFGPSLLLWLGQEPHLAEPGGEALQMFAIGMPGVLLFLATSYFLEGIGRPRVGMVITFGANFLNAGLGWVLIHGHLGLPPMGAAGAALAMTLTRYAMLGAALVYLFFLMADRVDFGIVGHRFARWPVAKRLLKIGLPLAVSTGLQTAAFASIINLAGLIDKVVLAAYQICQNVVSLVFMLSLGLMTGTAVRVANAVGRNDRKGRADAGWAGLCLVIALQAVVGLIIFLAKPFIASIYTDELPVLALAIPGLMMVAINVLFDGSQQVLQGALRASGDIWVPLFIYVIAYWGITVPLAHYFGETKEWGAAGLLTATLIGLALATLGLALRFRQLSRREVRPM